MEHDFRRRCEAALTHPVTLAALGALLVNDVVFKTLFPGAWAVGKLSDLAWVVFASPLLAFALSFAVPKSAAGRRAALIAAYGGLPLLYAAFNTFAPVHDAVMRVLLIGADGAARGSPMDATDSLAIPFGLAIAAWAYRRGVPAGGRLRFRFAALVAGIAALASVATSQDPAAEGVDALGATGGGAVVAGSAAYLYGGYKSEDGGMSWSWDDNDNYRLIAQSSQRAQTPRGEYVITDSSIDIISEDGQKRELVIVQSSQRAQTPRGEYVITDSGIERVGEDGRRELVYSTEYLRGDANKWVQKRDTQGFGRRFLTTRPKAILYHADSGNVIAAMGIQGAAVGTPNGDWRRVAVGGYSPTDFSLSAKTRTLLESGWLVGALAIALSLSTLTVAATASASEYEYDRERDALYIMLIALGCLAAVGMMFAAPAPAAPVAALTPWIAMNIAASKSNSVRNWRFALLGCVSTLSLSVGLTLRFGVVSGNLVPPPGDYFSYSDINAALAIAAFISLIPPLAYHARFIARHWRPFALAFLGMNALIALAFLLWVQMNVSLAATQAAIVGLVGLAAVVLVRRVRGGTEWG